MSTFLQLSMDVAAGFDGKCLKVAARGLSPLSNLSNAPY